MSCGIWTVRARRTSDSRRVASSARSCSYHDRLERKLPGTDAMSRVPEWKSVASEIVGDYGAFRVRRHRMESPRTGGVHEFHVVDVPMCVHVVPFTTDGRVILVEQLRSEEHTSELQSRENLVCRLLLEK